MSTHTAAIRWRQDEDDHFNLGRYTRVHEIAFDGGTTIQASGAPGNVPAQFSSEVSVDPEELFVSSLSSCHMLWFLDIARRAGVEVLSYEDQAEGVMEQDGQGRTAITRVTLRPRVETDGDLSANQLTDLHAQAHDACFIANSVKTVVAVEPVI
ncbi:OsmC family protein [Tianweitania sp. BSSL-BM11]|uniref:OsmC family protein n=1 Tax=Tianweitania aestuarii TaxID=2814886 RepID=A0ABS5S003_9HYPH|nr:OsmC family protein [Tianweitania aestuarii]MBS9721784.1 OsmC family protein [Tianweitania aestuarii]